MEQSKRQQRKAARGGTESRPRRRAEERAKSALVGYELGCKADRKNGAKAFVKPGAQKHW